MADRESWTGPNVAAGGGLTGNQSTHLPASIVPRSRRPPWLLPTQTPSGYHKLLAPIYLSTNLNLDGTKAAEAPIPPVKELKKRKKEVKLQERRRFRRVEVLRP